MYVRYTKQLLDGVFYRTGWDHGYAGRSLSQNLIEALPPVERKAYVAGNLAGDKAREAANARAEHNCGC